MITLLPNPVLAVRNGLLSRLCCLMAAACLAGVFPTSCAQRQMPPPLSRKAVDAPALTAAAARRGLVPADAFDPAIRVARPLPYATPRNVFGRVLYAENFPALLSEPTARKLAVASRAVRAQGYRLLVWDGYRPPEVQWELFQQFRSPEFVADPRKRWSKHCYGRAVDVTLADASGRPVALPSAFDDFSEKAAARYTGGDPAVKRHLRVLQDAMTAAGFSIYTGEWWHFNDLSDPAAFERAPVFGRELGLAPLSPP